MTLTFHIYDIISIQKMIIDTQHIGKKMNLQLLIY